ncbi:MAG: tyrosine--tRNA ligase [Planctomycetota bacterium]|nr:MAG: tyrosine--tRNA ligase [Planctomycetota bacterium]
MNLITEIRRYSSDIIGEEQLVKMLEKSASEKKPLRVKFGIDPTFPDVHLGHAVPIRLLRLFQEHGHLPVLILGDGTARLGDPTGRNDQRPPLTPEQVEVNAKTYLVQIGKLLDLSKGAAEVRRNTEWFGKMDFFDCLQLAAKSTAARLLERDDFQKRMQANLPVHLHEMMYPLMQGLDSVKVEADVELGGNDQLFNLHMGRQMQEREGQRPQVCITTPLLLGTDGRKMSKTYGNHVGLNASADDMFGKVMSLSDEGMASWFALATRLSTAEIEAQLQGHPREAKDCLARSVVAELHSEEAATAASEEFVRRFQKKEKPSEIPEKQVAAGTYALPGLMKAVGLANSTSEARRLVEGGGVRIDDEVIKDVRHEIMLETGGSSVLMQAGKRRFARISAE